MFESTVHFVIPDTQVKPGVPMDHLRWIGQYLVDQFAGKANVKVIHLGDHWDMPSLSSYDTKGGTHLEGQRINADIKAGNEAFALLNKPLEDYNAKRRYNKEKTWYPSRRIVLRGNHEDRITRAVDNDAQLEGFLSLDLLLSPGWDVVPYLKPIFMDGVGYAHFWQNTMTGRPLGGAVATRLKTLGHSFSMGHQQLLDYSLRFVAGRSQHGLVAGACYLHDEGYKGFQGNAHWRGIVICHDVRDGSYDPMFVSLEYLCRRYEGIELSEFMQTKYGLAYMAG